MKVHDPSCEVVYRTPNPYTSYSISTDQQSTELSKNLLSNTIKVSMIVYKMLAHGTYDQS